MDTLAADTRALLQRLAAARGAKSWELPIAQVRAGYDAMLQQLFRAGDTDPAACCGAVRDLAAPRPGGGEVPVRYYRPAGAATAARLPCILYMHGGGWTQGSVAGYDAFCRVLCAKTGAAVASVEYRLAPEHRAPAAAEDCYAALRWLAGAAGPAGVDAARVALAGDSAGGNLAAVTALRAAADGPAVAAQVLLCPVTDCVPAAHGTSYADFADGFLLTAESMRWFVGNYCGERPSTDWRESPARAPAALLSRAAPALIVTADHDLLRDEGRAYAGALRAAGVSVEYREHAGQVHVFWMFGRAVSAAAPAIDELASALRARLRLPPPAKL